MANIPDDGLELDRNKPKERIEHRCKWWNRGYCREANKCVYNHPEGDCLDHLKEECFNQGCKLRHRRRCKYWGTGAGCYNGTQCQYTVDPIIQNVEMNEAEKQYDLEQ